MVARVVDKQLEHKLRAPRSRVIGAMGAILSIEWK